MNKLDEKTKQKIMALEAYDRYLDAIRSSASQLETAFEKGEQKGEQRGEQKKAIEIAQRLLDVMDVATIAKTTGLTPQAIEELKKIQSTKKNLNN